MGSYSTTGLLGQSTEGAAPPDSTSLILHVGTVVPRSLSQLPSFSLARRGFGCAAVGASERVYVCVWAAGAVCCGDGGGVLQVCPLSQEDFLSYSDTASIQTGKTGESEVWLSFKAMEGLSVSTCPAHRVETQLPHVIGHPIFNFLNQTLNSLHQQSLQKNLFSLSFHLHLR